jgi:sarcosine oxidase delta subunit
MNVPEFKWPCPHCGHTNKDEVRNPDAKGMESFRSPCDKCGRYCSVTGRQRVVNELVSVTLLVEPAHSRGA